MLHAGTGETHVNNLLTSMNVPPIHHKTLKRREREAGKGLETVTNRVMAKALLEEVTKRQVSFSPKEGQRSAPKMAVNFLSPFFIVVLAVKNWLTLQILLQELIVMVGIPFWRVQNLF